jgi:hypothetical protein
MLCNGLITVRSIQPRSDAAEPLSPSGDLLGVFSLCEVMTVWFTSQGRARKDLGKLSTEIRYTTVLSLAYVYSTIRTVISIRSSGINVERRLSYTRQNQCRFVIAGNLLSIAISECPLHACFAKAPRGSLPSPRSGVALWPLHRCAQCIRP